MSGLSTTWLLFIIFLVDAVIVSGVVYFRARKRKGRPRSACFDFDLYKERELLRRGLLERGRW